MTRPDLIALDLDGTLLDTQRVPCARAVAAIQALSRQGVLVVLATGRPPRHTRDFVVELGLEHAIVYNGASRLHAPSETCVHHHQLEAALAQAVIARLRAGIEDVALGMETHHGWYLDRGLEALRRVNRQSFAALPPDGVGPIETFVRDGAIKVFARHAELGAAEMASALGDLDVYATWSGVGLLEVMHPAVNKREALETLAGEQGIARDRVAFFGDEKNDIEALRWAGCGVAMANASAEAQAAADEVTASNDEHGVALVLERWLG